jgi:hypothetical protein
MAHPPELIQKILELVKRDYRAQRYRYRIEKGIRNGLMPDISIYEDGNLICVVEIGYTRPEKLIAYCEELKIPDVRWYDKAGNLYCVNRPQRIRRPMGEFIDLRVGNVRSGVTGLAAR